MTLAKLFAVLFAVNLLTVGGGYVTLPLLHRFFVEDFGWLTSAELAGAVAVGQLTPGPMTIMNVFVGQKVAGFPGAVTAAVASYLPSLLVVSLVARAYPRLRESAPVAAALRGLKAGVAGMLLAVTVQLAGASLVDGATVAIGAASFAAMAFTRVDPTLLVAAAALAGAALLSPARRRPMRLLVIVNDAPYGSERTYNALRLAGALLTVESDLELTLFLLGDAVSCAKSGQTVPQGYYNVERMVGQVTRRGLVLACETCLAARGLRGEDLAAGCRTAKLGELASLVLEAEKVLTF